MIQSTDRPLCPIIGDLEKHPSGWLFYGERSVGRIDPEQPLAHHRKEVAELYLEIILERDFDPSILDGKKYRRRGNIITANGPKEEMLAIIRTLESVGGDRTIIMREVKNEQKD